MEPPLLSLPQINNEKQTKFLNKHLKTENDLFHKSTNHLKSSLTQQCSQLELHIHNLHNRLTKRTVSWISRSFYAKSAILKLIHTLPTSPYEVDSKRFQWVLNEELPRLADQMNRIESIRSYLAVQLEALVGDLEDTALFVMARHTGNMFSVKLLNSSVCADTARKHDKLLQAIKAMNDIEEVMITILKFHPQWHCLTRSVDNRVNKILSALRPQLLSDHRALLVSLGWPPKLLTSKNGSGQVIDIPNPLVLMQEDKRRNYSQSFIALCAFQHLRTRREERQLNFIKQEKDNIQLWAIDELVSPIASRMKCHFAKWTEQPEYMFALVYKVTRDFIIGIDDVLQPLVDRARLIRCSAKEAWVSAMVQSLSGFLEKNVFSLLAERYNVKHLKPDVISSWLHVIDLIIAFDKQMQSLVNLDISVLAETESFEGLSRGMSVLSIFSDRHDWLKIWAKIELKNACKTINTELKEEKAWMMSNKYKSGLDTYPDYLLSTIEDHRAPPIAELSLKILWDVIRRCQTMPSILSRALFIRSTAGRFLWYFFKILLLQFKAIELRPENSDDVAMVKACGLINASRYIWIKLQEWSDAVEFLEINIAENSSGVPIEADMMDNDCFFGEEIRCLSEIETNWLMEIIVVVLRQFEMLSCEYVQNKDNYKDDTDLVLARRAVDLVVSTDLVEALDYLKSRLQIARLNLTTKDFLDLWRSIAEGLDHYISCSIATSEIRFSKIGISQFKADMQALVFIFQPYCALPQAFFPCINEILKVLELTKEEVKLIMQVLLSNEENRSMSLQLYGIFHLSGNQVLQVLRYRN
ncbi:PREDICTED: RINT1-like protein MAG2L isoform X2 [Lupinus angustifolius]|uniref:RINT1-like protein MAG2L isoform X2 n=1 Tax=Lupinus angustifolius TaxID=3871 RepID=UPI00092F6DE2|nr:PREDICTED: RINT1-like protein MAG2L isoform X2 [Lupinus angustifolius]